MRIGALISHVGIINALSKPLNRLRISSGVASIWWNAYRRVAHAILAHSLWIQLCAALPHSTLLMQSLNSGLVSICVDIVSFQSATSLFVQ